MFNYDQSENISVLLAVSNLIYEYFDGFTFETMELITDKRAISGLASEYGMSSAKIFLSNLSATPSVDFFILKITDERGIILKIIQENLPFIKILAAPDNLKEELKERIDLYFKNEVL